MVNLFVISSRTVNNMARILQKFIGEGRQLHEPETVQASLQQGIRTKNEQVDSVSFYFDFIFEKVRGVFKRKQISKLR